MTWTGTEGSKVFVQWMAAMMGGGGASNNKMPSSYTGLTVGTDTIKAALYGNTGTPDANATYDKAGYNATSSQWVTANEKYTNNWAQGGIALTGMTSGVSSNVYTFDAADTPSSGAVTLSSVYGCLVYDDSIGATNTVADQAVCFNYFGGAQSVTSGTFTIVWNTSGIFTITV